MGQIGVLIQSWKLDGSDSGNDSVNWLPQWDRREISSCFSNRVVRLAA